MNLNEISQLLSEKWNAQVYSPISTLEMNLMDAMRNLEYNNTTYMSEICVTPIDFKGGNTNLGNIPPSNNLHIIIGVISDMSFTANIKIGGKTFSEPINVIADIPTPILVDKSNNKWPIVNLEYHEIHLLGVPKNAKTWAIGVRILKDKLQIINKSIIPDMLSYKKGMALIITSADKDIPKWSPLNI